MVMVRFHTKKEIVHKHIDKQSGHSQILLCPKIQRKLGRS